MNTTRTRRLVETLYTEATTHNLPAVAAAMRHEGYSWQTIADHIHGKTGERVTDVTIATWYPDPEN